MLCCQVVCTDVIALYTITGKTQNLNKSKVMIDPEDAEKLNWFACHSLYS
jgi:hypothetical protein